MPKVPTTAPDAQGNVVPLRQPPSFTNLAMAAAMMHSEGRLFEPVGTSEMGAISRFGRPNVKAGVPTKDRLKFEERRMEGDQLKNDLGTDENLGVDKRVKEDI